MYYGLIDVVPAHGKFWTVARLSRSTRQAGGKFGIHACSEGGGPGFG